MPSTVRKPCLSRTHGAFGTFRTSGTHRTFGALGTLGIN